MVWLRAKASRRCAFLDHVHAALQVWVLAAQHEIRQLHLDKARTILGTALGMCPKHKVFKAYIEIELQLGNIERCRKWVQALYVHSRALHLPAPACTPQPCCAPVAQGACLSCISLGQRSDLACQPWMTGTATRHPELSA